MKNVRAIVAPCFRRLAGAPARHLLRIHRDERGTISVLVLLTIWCLVAMLAMLWNTTEQAVNRQRVQATADSASHMAATWIARSVNATAAQNMVMGQDASTEVIWRAAISADQALHAHFNNELALAARMMRNPQWDRLRARFGPEISTIKTEYTATAAALTAIQGDVADAGYKDAQEAAANTLLLQQTAVALQWVNNNYLNGQGAPKKGVPGPNGDGLIPLINNYPPLATEAQILATIVTYINGTELTQLTAFENWTRPATSQPIDAQMAAHENEVYQNELAMAAAVPDAVEASRVQLSSFYQSDLTLATLNQGNTAGAGQSSPVVAGVIPASDIPTTIVVDTIRAAYPTETAAANLNTAVTIDPINTTEDNRIWHPTMIATVDAATLLLYPNLPPSFTIQCNLPTIGLLDPPLHPGWADVRAAPLEWYIHERVNRDRDTLGQMFMNSLDTLRTGTLAEQVRTLIGVPQFPETTLTLPNTIPDDVPMPVAPGQAPGGAQVLVLPRLTPPAGASANVVALYAQYNLHGRAYTSAVQNLAQDFQTYLDYYNSFTAAFAWNLWDTHVQAQCLYVLDQLGQGKKFMVLATHQLRMIPEWARPALYQSVVQYVENAIISLNLPAIEPTILGGLINRDPGNFGQSYLDPRSRQRFLSGQYAGPAQAIAEGIIRAAALRAAQEIATECLNRPWPFEITPPGGEVPPLRGMGVADRQMHFTVLAAARQMDSAGPRLLLPTVLNSPDTPMVAYAQAEAFNWMEFNSGYGGAETFIAAVPIPEFVFQNSGVRNFLPVPRCWRVATIGGWNWRARLSLADALYAATQTNSEFAQYLNSSGMTAFDQASINELNLH